MVGSIQYVNVLFNDGIRIGQVGYKRCVRLLMNKVLRVVFYC